MAVSDLIFTFSTRPFMSGIRAATRGFDRMTGRMTSGVDVVSRGVGRVVNKIAALAAGFFAIRGALRQMPEVGEAFGIAKDIFLRNLLFPLRQEIMPLLQRMLDWVRDNRSAFVKWGQVLVGIFRAVVTALGGAFRLLRRVGDFIMSTFQDLFGTAAKDTSEFINLMLFKLAVAFEFVKLLLGQLVAPGKVILDNLGSIVKSIVQIVEKIVFAVTGTDNWGDAISKIVKFLVNIVGFVSEIAAFTFTAFNRFIDGFLKGVQGIEAPIKTIRDAVVDLVNAIVNALGGPEGILNLLEGFGEVMGRTVLVVFQTIAAVVESIREFFEGERLTAVMGQLRGILDELSDFSLLDLLSPTGSQGSQESIQEIVRRGEELDAQGVPIGGRARENFAAAIDPIVSFFRDLGDLFAGKSGQPGPAKTEVNIINPVVNSQTAPEGFEELGAAAADGFTRGRIDAERRNEGG